MGQAVEAQSTPGELTRHRTSLNALTGIRFFASFYVVVFHSRLSQIFDEHGHSTVGNFFSSGYLAVQLFFLLSGFILAYTYVGELKTAANYRRFFEARFARIWPVYAASLLLSSLPALSFPKPSIMLAALLMVQAWNPFDIGMAGAWNLVCWTLSVEALFYVCFPAVQVWLERRTSRTQLLTISSMLIVTVLLNSGLHTLGPVSGISRYIPLPLWHLSEFFVGVGMGNFFVRRRALGSAGVTALFGTGVWTYVSAIASIALLCRPSGRWTSVVVITFAALIFGLASERTWLSRFLSTPAMLLGGGISYSMYLMQMPVKAWVNSFADRVHLQSTPMRLGLSTGLLFLVSLTFYKAVEDPARKIIRTAFASMEQRRLKRSASNMVDA